MLVESTTTAIELIEQLIDTLGLTGGAEDYVLEERNLMTNGKLRIVLTIGFASCSDLTFNMA